MTRRHHKRSGGVKTYTRKKSSAQRKAKTLRNKGCGVRIQKLGEEMRKKHNGARYAVVKTGPCDPSKRRGR